MADAINRLKTRKIKNGSTFLLLNENETLCYEPPGLSTIMITDVDEELLLNYNELEEIKTATILPSNDTNIFDLINQTAIEEILKVRWFTCGDYWWAFNERFFFFCIYSFIEISKFPIYLVNWKFFQQTGLIGQDKEEEHKPTTVSNLALYDVNFKNEVISELQSGTPKVSVVAISVLVIASIAITAAVVLHVKVCAQLLTF